MCVEVEREDEESVLVTIKGNIGIAAQMPLGAPWEDERDYIFVTDRVAVSLSDDQFQDLVEEVVTQNHIDKCRGC